MRPSFTNRNYNARQHEVLVPIASHSVLQFWANYFMRYSSIHHRHAPVRAHRPSFVLLDPNVLQNNKKHTEARQRGATQGRPGAAGRLGARLLGTRRGCRGVRAVLRRVLHVPTAVRLHFLSIASVHPDGPTQASLSPVWAHLLQQLRAAANDSAVHDQAGPRLHALRDNRRKQRHRLSRGAKDAGTLRVHL